MAPFEGLNNMKSPFDGAIVGSFLQAGTNRRAVSQTAPRIAWVMDRSSPERRQICLLRTIESLSSKGRRLKGYGSRVPHDDRVDPRDRRADPHVGLRASHPAVPHARGTLLRKQAGWRLEAISP